MFKIISPGTHPLSRIKTKLKFIERSIAIPLLVLLVFVSNLHADGRSYLDLLGGWGPETLINTQQQSYRYAPAIIQKDGKVHLFSCSSGGRDSWDYIRYSSSDDARNWTPEKLMLRATDAFTSKDRSACDPSIVFWNNYYYLFYSGNVREAYCDHPTTIAQWARNGMDIRYCGQSAVFVARASRIEGPYLKYTAGGWESGNASTTPNPTPLLLRDARGPAPYFPQEIVHGYGAGQQSVVVHQNKLWMWYYDDSKFPVNQGAVYMRTATSPTSWGEAQITNVRSAVSPEVKYDPGSRKFVMFSFGKMVGGKFAGHGHHDANISIITRTSDNGINWSEAKEVFAPSPRTNYASNLGVSSFENGYINPELLLVGYGAIPAPPTVCYSLSGPRVVDPLCWARWNLDGIALSNFPVKVFRSYSPRGQFHYYTPYYYEHARVTSPCTPGQLECGYANEAHIVPFHVFATPEPGTVPIWRLSLRSINKHYYTLSYGEALQLVSSGWTLDKSAGYIYASARPNAREIFHLYHKGTGAHFYTSSSDEKNIILRTWPTVFEQHRSLGWAPMP